MKLSAIHEHRQLLLNNSEQGYDRSQSTPAAIKKRSERNKARRRLEKQGRVKKGDGKHVDHVKPLSKGGSNKASNLAVVDAKTNWREGNTISSGNKRRKKS